ncbi:hypothetical protein MBLNU459_g7889t1 [Dothideomycetes sp. NU459]
MSLHWSRGSNGAVPPAPSLETSPEQSNQQSPRPTSSQAKRHAHFEDTPPEDGPVLRRTNTAPSHLQQPFKLAPSAFYGRTASYDRVDQINKFTPGVFEHEQFWESFESLSDGEGEHMSLYNSSPIEEDEGREVGFFDLETEGMLRDGQGLIAEVANLTHPALQDEHPKRRPMSGRQLGNITRPSFYLSRQRLCDYDPHPFATRRPATPPINQSATTSFHRSSSLSDLYTPQPELCFRMPRKSLTAAAATTHVVVHATIDADSSGHDIGNFTTVDEKKPVLTAQTVSSGTGTRETPWGEEPTRSSSESSESLSIPPYRRTPSSVSDKQLRPTATESPIEKVKTKLAACPDDTPSDEEVPGSANPFERNQSLIRRRSQGNAPTQNHEEPSTAGASQRDEEQEADSITSSGHASPRPIAYPSHSRSNPNQTAQQWATSTARDNFLATHRDSFDLAQQRLLWPTVNPTDRDVPPLQPSHIRDSFVIAKSRFDKYPKAQALVDPLTGQIKLGGLSPIMDASPPDPRAHFATAGKHKWGREDGGNGWKQSPEIGGHPANDHDCPICAIERPRGTRLERRNADER